MQELVVFQTGNIKFALDRDCIEEIRPIPDSPILTRGNLQQTITQDNGFLLLIDLASDADHCTPPPPASDAKLITVKGTPPFALLADHVKETLEPDDEQIEALPTVFANTACACFPRVARLKQQLALIIDPHALATHKIDADRLPDAWDAQQNKTEDNQDTQTTDMEFPPPPSEPSDSDTLGSKVEEILRKIIEQRVEKKVAETLAQTLEASFW